MDPAPWPLDRAGADGLARWWVRLADLSYDGKVLAPADWTEDQVRAALRRIVIRLGDNVTRARLYSPQHFHDDH